MASSDRPGALGGVAGRGSALSFVNIHEGSILGQAGVGLRGDADADDL